MELDLKSQMGLLPTASVTPSTLSAAGSETEPEGTAGSRQKAPSTRAKAPKCSLAVECADV